MRYLFSRGSRRPLETFARSNVLLAFDFDGTLAPLVDQPAAAEMRLSTRGLLAEACALYPCAVISGRARHDASRRLRGVALRQVVGNHGAETSPAASIARWHVRRWLPQLRAHLTHRDGVVIEDKALSVAVHYRQAPRTREARRAIMAAARGLKGVRVVGGAFAVNLLVRGAPHKGDALDRVRAALSCDTAIYVGDDVTDEDVFATPHDGRLLSIRVGRRGSSAASHYIHAQTEVDRLLEILARLRVGG